MHCFERSRRLLHKVEFDRVFSKSNKIVTKDFIVFYCENTLDYSRLGMAIAKKNIAKAFQRNRVKRLVRESFRQNQIPSVDLVFLSRKGLSEVDNRLIINELSHIWVKLNRLFKK